MRSLRWVLPVLLIFGGTVAYFGYNDRHLLLAKLASWQKDWKATRRYSLSHLQNHKDSPRAMLLLARSFRQTGDASSAENVYRQLMSNDQAKIPIGDLRWLTEFYRGTGQIPQLMAVDHVILDQRKDDPDALLSLASIYRERREDGVAMQLARRATEAAPDRVDAWVALFWAQMKLNQVEPSIESLKRAIALQPENVWVLKGTLADVLLNRLGDPDGAIEQLQQVLEEQPDDAGTHNTLAECYRQKEQFELARQSLERALEIDPNFVPALVAFADLELHVRGDWQKAQGYVERTLKQDPGNTRARLLARYIEEAKEGRTGLEEVMAEAPPPDPRPVIWQFTEVAREWGVHFHHNSGENKQKRYFPETLGSGVAILDYDGDGRMDLYFVNFTYIGPDDPRRTTIHPRNALYRNLGGGRFQDVTESSGLGDDGPGHGVAVGDFDNDGDPDVYVTHYGLSKLFRNNGDGTFTDITNRTGVANTALSMSTSAAWFDYDEDGDLDLYVCNYGHYDVRKPKECQQPGIGRIYCGPQVLQSQRDTFYRNDGDGTFTDVTEEMRIEPEIDPRKMGKGLGIVAADLNQDRHIDLFIANDTTPNFAFFGDGRRLVDVSAQGAAVNNRGDHEACMGVDAGDVNGDGSFDVIVTNQWNEKNTLYINQNGVFNDATDFLGLAAGTKRAVGWGTALVDFDNDGDLDNFVTNGHFYDWRTDQPWEQTAMLWENTGNGAFTQVSSQAGPYFQKPTVGRGAAFGDLDNDGDIDIVLNHWNRPCEILRNDTSSSGAWIRLQLVGVQSNRDAVGTLVELQVGSRKWPYQRKGGGSYLSSNDPRLLIGLGPAEKVDRLTVRWPSGQDQDFADLDVRQSYLLIEGQPIQPLTAP